MAISTKPYCIKYEYEHTHYYPYDSHRSPYSKGRSEYYAPPELSDPLMLKQQLIGCLAEENQTGFLNILEGDFVLEDTGKTKHTGGRHLNTLYEIQGDYYTNRMFKVRPVYEQLLLLGLVQDLQERVVEHDMQHNTNFLPILQRTFCKLDLADDEGVVFDFNIRGVSFDGASLGCSRFYNVIGVDFSCANLSNTEIAQEQLDQSSSYKDAKLPKDVCPWWSKDMVDGITVCLDKVKRYAEDNIPKNDSKYNNIMTFYEQQTPVLSSPQQPTTDQKRIFLTGLNKLRKETETNRSLSFIFGEILAFFGLMAVGYLAVGCYRKYKHGYFGLFSQPKSNQLVEATQQCVAGY